MMFALHLFVLFVLMSCILARMFIGVIMRLVIEPAERESRRARYAETCTPNFDPFQDSQDECQDGQDESQDSQDDAQDGQDTPHLAHQFPAPRLIYPNQPCK